uniref:STI1 domain-containing protein n=1 Tax=Pseudo-nitzschia australis TaxID=44445 RepID=A0A7S4EKI1_9STRA|mmetsp:Transcript_27620/g.60814  ORF Transcript_27620/g.60814 Transcript_27620/m.60814 type:complete len:426 (+) Transcript_27620:160-1437(+)
MARVFSVVAILASVQFSNGFVSPLRSGHSVATSASLLQNKFDPNEYAKSMSSAAIDQMKNLKPEDIDKMMEEMENMNPIQKSALKAMNMDPEVMKKTMQMMRDNPAMVANAQKVMETMSPDELLEQSRKAQEQLKNMTPEELEKANEVMQSIPEDQMNIAVETMKAQKTSEAVVDALAEDESDVAMVTGPGSSSDSNVVDAMFRVAEFMSDPPTDGGATFGGFYSLPVIQLLSGDREFDLSMSELKECWADGSLGATRVDRTGFERVWNEVQEYFEQDIMTEARKEARKKLTKKKVRPTATTTSTTPKTTIGDNLSQKELEEVNERVKNLSNDEVGSVLDMMEQMDPAQEARLKSMGVDPSLMQQTAAMLRDNPQMREQAKQMMQNMSPDDMLKASQQAQEQMSNMSEDDLKKAMSQLQDPPPSV